MIQGIRGAQSDIITLGLKVRLTSKCSFDSSEIKASFSPNEDFLSVLTSCGIPSGESINCPLGSVCQFVPNSTQTQPKCINPIPSNCPKSKTSKFICCQGLNCNLDT